MRYFIHFSYNGSFYHGWQRQPNAITVQEEMENAFARILQTPIVLTAAGRTDTGVHAKHMVAHFDFEEALPDNLCFIFNQYFPAAIAVQSIHEVPANAHARFDALSRTYQYHISFEKDPFHYPYHYHLKGDLNFEKMNAAAETLMAYEDFECFSKVHTDVKTFLCKIESAHWERDGNQLTFTIKANRFLRNMVRAIVGTLVEIGQEKRTLASLQQTIQSKNRSEAGYSVPAHALFLTDISYPKTHLAKHV